MNRFVLFTIAVLSFLPAHARAQQVPSRERYVLALIANQQAENIRKRAENVLENCLKEIGTT